MLARAALGGIWVYQRYVSPRKGYRCAHAVLHGGTGCSGFVKHAIRDHGLLRAVGLARTRFRDCRAAFETLQIRYHGAPEDPHRKKRKSTFFRWCDYGEVCCFACTPRVGGGTASKGCDTNPCDGDCAGCDCSPCN